MIRDLILAIFVIFWILPAVASFLGAVIFAFGG